MTNVINFSDMSTAEINELITDLTVEIHRRTAELDDAMRAIDGGIKKIQGRKCQVRITNDYTGEYVDIHHDEPYTIELD